MESDNSEMEDEKTPLTMEALLGELHALQERAKDEIQTTWSEIENLEAKKASILERNSLISEKIKMIEQRNNRTPIIKRSNDETWEGRENVTCDNAPWLGWNVSAKSGLCSYAESSTASNIDQWFSQKSKSSNALDSCPDIVTNRPLQADILENDHCNDHDSTFVNEEIDCTSVGGPKSGVKSFFEKKLNWTKKNGEGDNQSSDEQTKKLRQTLANLESESIESFQQLKEKIIKQDEAINELEDLSEKQDKVIKDKEKVIQRLQQEFDERTQSVRARMVNYCVQK